jgi:deoxycytidylate deaminase
LNIKTIKKSNGQIVVENVDIKEFISTHSPCKECSKVILQSGIKRLLYIDDYKELEGVQFLIKSDIQVEKIEI